MFAINLETRTQGANIFNTTENLYRKQEIHFLKNKDTGLLGFRENIENNLKTGKLGNIDLNHIHAVDLKMANLFIYFTIFS